MIPSALGGKKWRLVFPFTRLFPANFEFDGMTVGQVWIIGISTQYTVLFFRGEARLLSFPPCNCVPPLSPASKRATIRENKAYSLGYRL